MKAPVPSDPSGDDEQQSKPAGSPPAERSGWQRTFNMVRMAATDRHRRPQDLTPEGRRQRGGRAWYRLDVDASRQTELVVIEVYQQRRRADSSWGRLVSYALGSDSAKRWSQADDRELVALLEATAPQLRDQARRYVTLPSSSHRSFVPALLHSSVLPRLCATGRFFRSPRKPSHGDRRTILSWHDGPPWTFAIAVEPLLSADPEGAARLQLTGRLQRGSERRSIAGPDLLVEGCLLDGDRLAAFDASAEPSEVDPASAPQADRRNALPWIWQLREVGNVSVSVAQLDDMLDELWNLPSRPPIEMPTQWPLEEVRATPRPRLVVRSPSPEAEELYAEVRFAYSGLTVPARDPRSYLVDRPRQRVLVRDASAEVTLAGQLLELGATELPENDRFAIELDDFPELVFQLLESGWIVEAEGKKVRPPGAVRLSVASGIDWLEMRGDVHFSEEDEDDDSLELLVPLPELLLAVRRQERLIRLGDGSQGILPQEWLQRYGPLARLGEQAEDAWRFLPSHAILIDALLEGEGAEVDANFERLRSRLRALDDLEPHPEPKGFVGELRPYQRHGLAWLHALRFLGLGGCLADDMGLGKTVQVLALLASRAGKDVGPSLVVVPRSLISNWAREAERFAPGLTVLPYHGPGRDLLRKRLEAQDVVITTYGTLCRDIEELTTIRFELVVLDEAQAIKNVFSQTSKACRRLKARQRLALTGTPVENHLGELGSIFGFLNPGMLGKVPGFEDLLGERRPDPDALAMLGRVLRPFILRRTKEAVLPELPEKTELILWCDLRERQKRLYDELRDHYRMSLSQRINDVGLERSKIQVLEALLRLRQAACHPGLVDPARGHERSTKLDVILRHLLEVLAEGHKALVFSQFTRFLGLLRQRLDRLGIRYEYLDGSTRDREAPVERFQTDPSRSLFLISLKAGGFGLNLTAASYVFLLDPWWNPAVEAQAIDRIHRFGQERPVFAYRLVARGTVEEKILDLQSRKRQLADAILSPGEGLMRTLKEDDLRWLLSD